MPTPFNVTSNHALNEFVTNRPFAKHYTTVLFKQHLIKTVTVNQIVLVLNPKSTTSLNKNAWLHLINELAQRKEFDCSEQSRS